MPVSSVYAPHSYAPGSAEAAEAIPFEYRAATDLTVTHVADDDGTRTALVPGTDFSIAGSGPDGTGTITAIGDWGADQFVIERATANTQDSNYPAHEAVRSTELQGDMDRLTMAMQEATSKLGRAWLSQAEELGGVFPAQALRPGMYLAFDANGDATVASGTGADADLRADMALPSGAANIGETEDGDVQTALDNLREDFAESAPFSHSGSYPANSGHAVLLRFPIASSQPWGVVADGATNNTAALQAAITANYGGTLFLPDGEIRISGEITIAQPIRIIGLGTRIVTTSATANVFKVTAAVSNPGVQIESIWFGTTATRTGGAYISNTTAHGTKVRHCRFDNAWIGVNDSGAATEGLEVFGCYFYATRSTCVGLSAQTSTQGSVYTIIENNTFIGASDVSQTPIAIQVISCGDCVIRGNSSLYCSSVVTVVPTTGQVVQLLTIQGNTWDSGSSTAIPISPTGGTVRSIKVDDNWIATFAVDGVRASGTGLIQSLEVQQNLIGNLGGNGVNIASTIVAEHDVRNNKIGGNVGSGYACAAGVSKFRVEGNTIGVTGQWLGNGGWDILVASGASDKYFITHNFTSGTGLGAISDGGTGVNKFVEKNIAA